MSSVAFQGVDARIWRPQLRFDQTIRAASQAERTNAEGGFAVSFSPHRGSTIDLHIVGSQNKNFSVWTTQSEGGFLSQPKLNADVSAIRFVTSGSILRRNKSGATFIGHVGYATFLGFEDMRECQSSTGFAALTATISNQAIATACSALEGGDPRPSPRFTPIVDMACPGMPALKQAFSVLHQRLQTRIGVNDFIFELLEEMIVYQVISTWPKTDYSASLETMHPNDRTMRRAIDYIEANLGRAMTIAEIAKAAGVGIRSLQNAFKKNIGVAPVQYLINRRLDLVHDMLKASKGELTIQQIATQWGFVHMSDFSRRYRQRFGHPPRGSRGR